MIVVITGPTGVGKTSISLKLAKHLNAEIISADSMQIYKELNIGVDKVKDTVDIKHHMINIVSIIDSYSVFDYQRDARKILNDLIKKNKNVIIVGGTGLYIKALLYNYEFEENKTNNDFVDLSNEELFLKIKELNDNISIEVNNRIRLVRTLNKLLSDHKFEKKGDELLYKDVVFIGVDKDRDLLYSNINKRVDEMFNNGLLSEFESIKHIDSRVLRTAIGYKELYLDLSIDDKKELIKKNTRNYAKRQFTWFNNKMSLNWVSNYEEVLKVIL